MEKRGTRLFQPSAAKMGHDTRWNIVELESRRDLRQKIDELISLTLYTTISTSELQHLLSLTLERYGQRFITLLVRALSTKDAEKRQTIVDLLTILNAPEAIPHLQALAQSARAARSVRLSASLALAGMNATPEMTQEWKITRTCATG